MHALRPQVSHVGGRNSIRRRGIAGTCKRDGKVVGVATYTLGSDGKLHVVNEDKLAGSTVKYQMTKQ